MLIVNKIMSPIFMCYIGFSLINRC